MKNRNKIGVFAAVRTAALTHRFLTVGTLLCVAASVGASLIPPLLLARVIDRLTGGLYSCILEAWRWRASFLRCRKRCWCCSVRK